MTAPEVPASVRAIAKAIDPLAAISTYDWRVAIDRAMRAVDALANLPAPSRLALCAVLLPDGWVAGATHIAIIEQHDSNVRRAVIVPPGQSLAFDADAATRRWLQPYIGTEWHLEGFLEIASPTTDTPEKASRD